MKSIIRILVPATVAALALVSCQREINVPVSSGEVHITVKATPDNLANLDTKTYIGTYDDTPNYVLWGTDEYMKIAVKAGESTVFGTSLESSANSFTGEPEAMFQFDITPGETAGTYTYMGLYPASAAVASNNTNPASYKVSLPSTQNATAASYDPSAYIMVAKPESFNEVIDLWVASYRRATALNKLTLKGLNEDIKRVKITAPEGVYMAGARHFDLTTGESGDIYTGGGKTETIEVKYANRLPGGSDMTIWFTSWDASIPVGAKLTIVAYSDTHTFTRELTVVNKPITFKEGYLNTLSVNMASAIQGDNTEFEEGNYVVLAKKNDNEYFALKAEKEEGKERLLSVAYEGSLTSYTGTSELVWSISKSGDSYIFANSEKYLGYKGSSNESYWLESGENWTEDNYLLDVTAQATAGLYQVTLHSNSQRVLAKNTNSAYFAFYTSTGQYSNLVFVPATVDNRTPVTLSFGEDAVSLTTANYNEFIGQDLIANPNVAAITDNISWSYNANPTTVVDEFDEGALTLSGIPGTVTVTASFAGDSDYLPATASYTITINEVVTSGWVLVDAANDVTEGQYVITWNNQFYLPSNVTATSNPVVGSGITVSNNGALSNEVTAAMIWDFTGNNTDGFTVSAGENYLNSTNKAQGISVSVSNSTTWTVSVDTNYGMLLKGSDAGSRYLAVYNDTDWRYYSAGNDYKGTLRLYKYLDSREDAGMSWSAASATASWDTGNTVSGFTAPTLTEGNATGITYESTNTSVATINSSGVVAIVGPGETTIKAIFAGDENYKPATVRYTLTVTDNREIVATPVFSPDASNTVSSGTQVTITTTTTGATIYYTLDGSTPSSESTAYSGAITLTESKTIKAIAVKAGYKDSEVASATYTVGVVNTSTEANPYSAAEAVAVAQQLAANGTLADVYVSGIISAITTAYNDSYKNVSFNISADGLTTGTQFLIFRASATSADDFKVGDAVEFKGTLINFQSSSSTTTTPEMQAAATLIYQVHAPIISPDGGTFTDSQSVTITADQDATIRYTVDGTTPTATVGSDYSGSLTLTETTTVKAFAVKNGISTGVVSATYILSSVAYTLFKTFTATGIGSGYGAHTGVTSDGINWTVTYGQTTYIGTNSNNKGNCKLGDTYAKVGTPCGYSAGTTQVAAVISESKLAGIGKVEVSGDTDNNNPQKISLVYSTDNTTYTLVETQDYSKANGNTFLFDAKSEGYYAVVLYYDGSGSGYMRTNNLKIAFYKVQQ